MGVDFFAAGPDARSSLPAIEGRKSDMVVMVSLWLFILVMMMLV